MCCSNGPKELRDSWHDSSEDFHYSNFGFKENSDQSWIFFRIYPIHLTRQRLLWNAKINVYTRDLISRIDLRTRPLIFVFMLIAFISLPLWGPGVWWALSVTSFLADIFALNFLPMSACFVFSSLKPFFFNWHFFVVLSVRVFFFRLCEVFSVYLRMRSSSLPSRHKKKKARFSWTDKHP